MAYKKSDVVRYQGGLFIALIDNPTLDPITGAGTQWNALAPIPGRAGMFLSAPLASPGDLGAGWNVLNYFDTVSFAAYGAAVDPVAGTWDHDFLGLWSENLFFNFYHDSSNQGRITYLRLWNVTNSVELGRSAIGIGRNQEATTFNYTGYFEIGATELNAVLRWEIGGGDVVAVDVWNNLNFSTIQVSVLA